MADLHPHSAARLAGRPVHAMLAPVPIFCFVAAWITDLAYWRTATMMWADMSAWLLAVGLVVAVLAVIAGVVDFFGDRRIRALRAAWVYGLSAAAALVLSIVNVFVHSRDAYTSVVPAGLVLSTLVVLILLVTGWSGFALVFRHGVGVQEASR